MKDKRKCLFPSASVCLSNMATADRQTKRQRDNDRIYTPKTRELAGTETLVRTHVRARTHTYLRDIHDMKANRTSTAVTNLHQLNALYVHLHLTSPFAPPYPPFPLPLPIHRTPIHQTNVYTTFSKRNAANQYQQEQMLKRPIHAIFKRPLPCHLPYIISPCINVRYIVQIDSRPILDVLDFAQPCDLK